MNSFPASAADPYTLYRRTGGNAPEVGEPFIMDGYTQVARNLGALTTGVVIVAGQSNVGNFALSSYSVGSANAHMLNPFNGGLYVAKDPVLGCNGGLPGSLGYAYNNCTSQMVDKLRIANWRQRVIMANVAAGGTSSTQWASGDCNNRARVVSRRVLAAGLTPTVIVWHQGEQNVALAISAAQTASDIRAVKATFVSEGVTCPMLVCKVAYTSTSSVGTAPYNAVRLGQTNALSSSLGIFAGPDTDVYGSTYRQGDDLHWNNAGASAVSTDLANSIMALVP